MVDPEFSEFQFAYGVTRELDDRRRPLYPVPVPFFPSQRLEADLGFDVMFPDGAWSLFLQFKRSKLLTQRPAREWDVYGAPYFRFSVRTSDNPAQPDQHERLVDLGSDFRHTYYVAPEFIEWTDYVTYARDERISQHAAFLRCADAPKRFDGESHYICHRPADSYGLFFSETSDPPEITAMRGFEELYGEMRERGPDFESISEMRDVFRSVRRRTIQELGIEIDSAEYDGEDAFAWIQNQQRFFYETHGTLLFFLTGASHSQ